MHRNRRWTVILVVTTLVGLIVFAFAYRVIAGQEAGNNRPIGGVVEGY